MIETVSVRLYVTLVNIIHFERQRFAENRGQASLEYIAIAAGIVVIAAALFIAFGDDIRGCGNNILARVFGGAVDTTQPCAS